MTDDPRDWEIPTRLVRGGTVRSEHGTEIAEALYLTQSFVYDTAESADARFAGNDPGFIYTRYGNPTVSRFEERLALVEGAEACRATASGMAAVYLALTGLLRAGDHVVAGKALFGSCRWILNTWGPRFRGRDHLRRRRRHRDLEDRDPAEHQSRVHREPGEPAAGDHRHSSGGGDGPRGWGHGAGRQRVRHADLPEAAAAGRRHRNLPRPPSTSAARAGCWAGRSWVRPSCWTTATATSSATLVRHRCRRSTPGCC